jgi:hypothetical protein
MTIPPPASISRLPPSMSPSRSSSVTSRAATTATYEPSTDDVHPGTAEPSGARQLKGPTPQHQPGSMAQPSHRVVERLRLVSMSGDYTAWRRGGKRVKAESHAESAISLGCADTRAGPCPKRVMPWPREERHAFRRDCVGIGAVAHAPWDRIQGEMRLLSSGQRGPATRQRAQGSRRR